VIAKRTGVVARWGLKEAWSKRRSRCTRTGSEAWLRSSHSFAAIRCWTSWHMTTKSISIKGTGCKSGGCIRKAVELTSGDLRRAPNGPRQGLMGAVSKQRDSMSDKRQKNQLVLAFVGEDRREAPKGVRGRDRIACGEARD
jgi:hypothetical protein